MTCVRNNDIWIRLYWIRIITRNMKKSYPKEVYLNGRWQPHDQAFVSVFDRGFLFGDGIYEVVPVYGNKAFTLAEHLDRMALGLRTVGIAYDTEGLASTVNEAIAKAGFPNGEGAVYIQVTRGVAPRSHNFPEDTVPTVLLYAFPLVFTGYESRLISVIVSKDVRWHRCDIKSISLIGNVLANEEGHSRGATENLLFRDGLVTEGSHSNVCFVKQGVVYTHPSGPHILPGITRKVVLELCREEGIEVREEAVAVDDLGEVGEAFLTGTTAQVLAIGKITHGEKALFSAGEAGPVTRRLQEAFNRKLKVFLEDKS